jgi:hypothetical protein
MARPLSELQVLLKGLDGVKDAYVQAPTQGLQYPCIMIERGLPSAAQHADNKLYLFKKAYTITVMDRAPDSPIPDLVEGLQDTRFDRFFRTDGLNHFVFQMFF